MTLYLSLMTAPNGNALADTTLRLVTSSLARTRSSRDAAVPARRFWLHRVWRHIEDHLCDPRLSPASIADALGLSRSTLYRHFSPIGGLVAYIRNRRVEAVRRLLHDPRERRGIAELARTHGFNGSGGFTSSFRRCCGHNPSVERSRNRALAFPHADPPHEHPAPFLVA